MTLINGFHLKNVRGDVLGGLTAAVVALPLALAFGNAALGPGGAIYGLYGAVGNHTLTLEGGKDYNGAVGIGNSGALEVSLAGLRSGYELYENKDTYSADFLLMGSANHDIYTAQSLANKLIDVE